MLWSELYVYVEPYVLGCPIPTMDHHIRLAAIEFCRRTACDQRTLDPVLTDGTVNLSMEADTGIQVNKVHAVAVDGVDWPIVGSKQGLELARSGSTQSFCFTQDNKTLQIYPLQVAGTSVVVDATVCPTRTATSIKDDIALDHIQDIAHGAIASIQRLPKQAFTDFASAGNEQAIFNSRIATVAAKVARGFMRSKMRSSTTYL